MNKIKIIEKYKQCELEKEVNSFIANKNVLNISYAAVQCGYEYIYSCCIFYQE